jgi:hypothetical protein
VCKSELAAIVQEFADGFTHSRVLEVEEKNMDLGGGSFMPLSSSSVPKQCTKTCSTSTINDTDSCCTLFSSKHTQLQARLEGKLDGSFDLEAAIRGIYEAVGALPHQLPLISVKEGSVVLLFAAQDPNSENIVQKFRELNSQQLSTKNLTLLDHKVGTQKMIPICGNGIVELPEQCDGVKGCEAGVCQALAGWSCSPLNNTCQDSNVIGDGASSSVGPCVYLVIVLLGTLLTIYWQ